MGVVQAVWMYLIFIHGFFLALRFPRDSNWGHRVGPIYARGVFFLGGMNFVVENREILGSQSPAILIANHQSVLDISFSTSWVPDHVVVMVKKSFLYVPVLGQLLWLANQIFIDRFHREKALLAMAEAGRRIKEDKVSIFMMPEGTRNDDSFALLPFKRGAFWSAIDAGVPLVPMVIAPVDFVVDRQRWRWLGGNLRAKILAPIQTKNKVTDDAGQLADDTRVVMQAELDLLISRWYANSGSRLPARRS